MAAREKTRDELDMQTLRELASLPANKFCFDCGQRGTTYVNVTIGAFVCSACGGLLRGLNPPHRVKSLTVCSFTEVEMDRIKSRGNEYCTHIWLGKYDPKTSEFDLSSPDKRKEFMILKYEEKKFYVDPREAIKKMKPRAPAVPTSITNSVTRSQTVIPNKQPSQVQKTGVISQTFSAGDISSNTVPDLFKDFENDPFKETKPAVNSLDGASFADFSSAFGNSGSKTETSSGQTQASTSVSSSSIIPSTQSSTSHKKPAPPPPDRYAALADLDNQLHQQAVSEIPASIPSMIVVSSNAPVFWTPPTISSAVFVPPTQNPFSNTAPTWSQPVTCAPNPFQSVAPQIPVSSNVLSQQNMNGISNAAKPSLPNGNVANSYWPSAPSPAWGAPFPSRQPDPFLLNSVPAVDSYNPWAQAFTSNGANPFANNSTVPGQSTNVPQTNTKNPFL
ncbi:arf-GAP domain and FG repeat-containing protein 1-like [Argiope bruennichi]|uniref:Arf-GAP domain and FG repeat-containing n=1 Tax=Argiope bruennichi TaxID=94029 RepID=A0A8T0FSM9_ARGBR|nr:arf-GAP domain and FG repeat-containing protein 1-like [Argiope bruennichi]KAF8793305.1 Arf-GAP domain and FG repeat-containing [Argiope bruennichi]